VIGVQLKVGVQLLVLKFETVTNKFVRLYFSNSTLSYSISDANASSDPQEKPVVTSCYSPMCSVFGEADKSNQQRYQSGACR
jgi:hypothetical protein